MRGVLYLVMLCLLWPGVSRSEHRALLIGVTDYAPAVTALAGPLAGPVHDVALMVDIFAGAGVAAQNMTVLSDGQDAQNRPTRANILRALDELARTATPDDHITLYLAGHGAQVPVAIDTTEPDGLDEVFLPTDFEILPGGGFRNMIRDDEIGARVDQMIAAGADVWLIADTCHSGSLRRSVGNRAVPRFVALVPTVTAGADPPIDIQTNSTTRAGQFIGFYAAAPGALAYETTPAGADTAHGLMTWSLAHALRTGRAQTYADLARLMTAQLWQTGGGLSEPAFDGAVGAPHVFAGTAQTDRTFGLEVAEGITVKAGHVDGLRPGAVIEIKDQAGNPLFDVTVTQVSLTQAQAPLPTGQAPALDALLRAEQLDPARFRSRWLADRAPTLVGRVVSMPLDTTLSVGLNLGAEDDGLRPAIEAMIKTLAPAVRHDDDTPDVQIASTGGTLGLRPVDPGAAQVLDLPARPDAIPALADTLRRMIKTRALLAAAVTLNDSALAQALDVDLSVQLGTDDGTGGCKPVGPAKRIDIAALHPPTIEHCDTVALTLRNDNPWPIDVSVFYLASDFQVYFLTGFGGSEKGGWRIPAGGTRTLRYTEATRALDGQTVATGQMHLALFAQRGKPGQTPFDLRYLQQLRPPPETRSAPVKTLSSVLAQAGFGLANRRSIDQTIREQSGGWTLPLLTRPDTDGGALADPQK